MQYQDLLEWLFENKSEFKTHVGSYKKKTDYENEWYARNGPVIFKELDKLFPSKTYRLPDTFYPEKYNLTMKPNIAEGTFEGKVQICVTPKNKIENEPYIILNSHELNLFNETVKVYFMYTCDPESLKLPIPVVNWTLDLDTQQLKIYLDRFISAEKISVEIDFSGNLADNMKGFYRSSYLDKSEVQQ